MIKRISSLLVMVVTIGLTIWSLPAHAGDELNGFVGVDAFNWSYDETGFSKVSSTGLRVRAGQDVTPNVGWEAHLATGGDDTTSGITLELDWLYSLFLRGTLPFGQARVSGLVGFTSVELTASGAGLALSGNDSGLSLGAMVDYALTKKIRGSVDYILYQDQGEYSISALSFGVAYTF